ncbi:FHA domain-containing protein [Pleurocapsa sp. PCC 7319]|uniref:FHA domain-containing protein n=1 Tax=Pleurocapsa sp. PCC 7319 TaxID=118161 RepID=UPI00034A8764|nr:FHA domain-containing protein [Pleurocapsa sp. PCC 7319]
MIGEYPYLEVTKPDGMQYAVTLENFIPQQTTENVYISIGRQSNNHIVLNDPQKKISRHHCSLQYQNNRWWIVDNGSANGTFLQREIDQPEIDVRSEDAIALRSGDYILILGALSSTNQPIFWRLEFIDPGETNQVTSMQAIHTLEYSLSRQMLYRNIVRRRDSISLGEQERCLIDYMSRKNHYHQNHPAICEYDELIQAVWQDDTFGRDRKAINHLVWRIRDKIELDSGEPQFLKTIKGRGYCLDIKIID